MGIPRNILPATPREVAKYALNFGWETASIHGESSRLLNVNGHPTLGDPIQVGYPSLWQPFPTTAADLIAALGATGVILPANVLAIYQCDTASPLVDALGLGPNLVAAGGPLTGRECVGLEDTSFVSKVGVELTGNNQRFADAGTVFMKPANNTIRSAICVWRTGESIAGADGSIFGAGTVMPYWQVRAGTAGANLSFFGNDGAGHTPFANVVWTNDNGWHCVAVSMNLVADTVQIFSDIGDSAIVAMVGDWSGGNANFTIGQTINQSGPTQVAYLACFDVALTSAQRAAFWRHAQAAGLSSTPLTYARANPLVCPISPSRVACYGAGQVAVGYDAGLASAANGNALGTGVVCEDGITFEPIGSTNIYGRIAFAVAGTKTPVTGPSGMQDAVRVKMTNAAWGTAGWGYSGPNAIAGASNVPWRFDTNYKRAVTGTAARTAMYFSGSAGGDESFNILNDAAAPVDWTRGGGTCTPTQADQTAFYATFGGNLLNDDADFGEPAVIKNRATPSLAWLRVGTAAAAATSTPSLNMTNVGNRRYNPLRGKIRTIISGFPGTNGATFRQFGAAASAGSLTLDYSGGQLRLRIWDATPALALTVLGGPLTNTRHVIDVEYDTQAPVRGIGGAYCALVVDGVVVGAWLATWTPPTADVTPLYTGSDAAGANSARCTIEEA